jgi:hypothetical protein
MRRRLPVLAIAAVALTPGSASASVFAGTTTADSAIVLRANANATKLESAVIAWSAECSDGLAMADSGDLRASRQRSGLPDAGALIVTRNRRGRFAGRQLKSVSLSNGHSAGVIVTLSGRMTGKRATGRLSASVTILDQVGNVQATCKTGSVKWAASREKGRIFGGSTSRDQPVVVRLNRARRAVRDLIVGWDSVSCTPGGYLATTDFFRDFPIRKERFGDAFSQDFTLDGGGKQTIAYDIAGRVSGRAASGSFSAKLTEFDAAGAQTGACDSGAVTWRARTG